ncbi:MAG: hypothetical protein A3H98_00420 [Bacteroidetes bacterium RIFCSPLOWO2_02_FULL_36_8]|nr:MAG: hypothetical protein A3H98_00420 [Bacteroidetes bacterium RIFCSPLOWO2_02_FULL_36_8]OFY71103.1 MAG: hypothetical protein A3G23_14940 [Bacteroidetes bacterium RIFCSPLOWO2_12_FULL_37_12]
MITPCRFIRTLFVFCLLNLAVAGSVTLLAQDLDGDGYDMSVDCNDNDSLINPGASEICDALDNNCDGENNEGLTFTTYYHDNDLDGYGDDMWTESYCFVPDSLWVLDGGDCNDWDPMMNPGASEICDALDNNCDGSIDEGLPITTYFRDWDYDGYGRDWDFISSCSTLDSTWSTLANDCDDWNAMINPSAMEICDWIDNNCTGSADEGLPMTTYYRDYDYDGYGDDGENTESCFTLDSSWSTLGGDCDNWKSTVHPGAMEICDWKDNNCNDSTDEGLLMITYYRDWDYDGYGVDWDYKQSCAVEDSSWSVVNGDCNYWDPMVHPGATEICDFMDNDCDSLVDEGVITTYYKDGDNDGYGTDWWWQNYCTTPADSSWILNGGDCNDYEPMINPSAEEVCDNFDNNCNGEFNEGFPDSKTYFYDGDQDGYGSMWDSVRSCVPLGQGWILYGGDCRDWDSWSYPGADEVCDGQDNDCDMMIDEGFSQSMTYYYDWDKDGYGQDWNSIQSCNPPDSNYVLMGGDCNDWNMDVHPGAIEICDDFDNDCDGMWNDSLAMETYYRDKDWDGYGSDWDSQTSCMPPTDTTYNYVLIKGDCDDWNFLRNPGMAEICDGLDNNCDSLWKADEGLAFTTYFRDEDNDGYGSDWWTQNSCNPLDSTWVVMGGDCEDWNPARHPGAPEICDGMDNNCDSLMQIDEGLVFTTYYYDWDNDGYGVDWWTQNSCNPLDSGWALAGGDCNDNNLWTNPGATEVCDGYDNDCDTLVNEGFPVIPSEFYYRDFDSDSFGGMDYFASLTCDPGPGFANNSDDCNDMDSTIHPGAVEVLCDSIDNNCNNMKDEGAAFTYFYDEDGDGFGNVFYRGYFCSIPPSPWVADSTDCYDMANNIYPGATELCDGKDNNCEGTADEGTIPMPGADYYYDKDGDTYGGEYAGFLTCLTGSGFLTTAGDCDDMDPMTYPGALDSCDMKDNDCDGDVDEDAVFTTYYYDWDGDGYGDDGWSQDFCGMPDSLWAPMGGDCNSGNFDIHPGAMELCDYLDNDCNGMDDDGLTFTTYYKDYDMDGYGQDWWTEVWCMAPVDSNWAVLGGDCDDWKPEINPSSLEICDDMDNDCNGMVDDGLTFENYYKDNDGDGYGQDWGSNSWCNPPVDSNWVSLAGDCNDWDMNINPGAAEICDGMDNNCDSLFDEGIAFITYYRDWDMDGYGQDAWSENLCMAPLDSGWAMDGGDCDDSNPSVNPGMMELCNGWDDNCNSEVDEGLPMDSLVSYFRDEDMDGFGGPFYGNYFCNPGLGFSTMGGDCKDWDATTYPGATEVCDGMDNDCNGMIDDGFTDSKPYYFDGDNDGFGNDGYVIYSCSDPDSGFIADGGDCDDMNPMIYPGAPEICDGMDNNCDGKMDDSTCSVTTYYRDNDGDGFGNWPENFSFDPGAGWSLIGGDCEDWKPNVHPGATEICNGYDDNCDGDVDEGFLNSTVYYYDGDMDGFGDDNNMKQTCSSVSPIWVLAGGDCQPWNPMAYPGTVEVCNEMDDNCDGNVDEGFTKLAYYYDNDMDGYGGNWINWFCEAPLDSNWTTTTGDCEDWDWMTHPGAMEVCDGRDNNCNGFVDEGLAGGSPEEYYRDWDGDGFGGEWVGTLNCSPDTSLITIGGDCNDWNMDINPNAMEIPCNNMDENCDGMVDEGSSFVFYSDYDHDGFGGAVGYFCDPNPGDPWILNGGDCADWNPMVNPAAMEICDGMDNNCDSLMDDNCTILTYYYDGDNDGFGGWAQDFSFDPGMPWILTGGDCNDMDWMVYPGNVEICDGKDNNCDGETDEGFTGATPTAYYYDWDMDGYGRDFAGVFFCTPGSNYTEVFGDCDDMNPMVHPDGTEICNELDDNCNGEVNEGLTGSLVYYKDNDNDGYGSMWDMMYSCDSLGWPWTLDGGDCEDWNPNVHPGATEICDNMNNNCDSLVDEGFTKTTYFEDYDRDGYGAMVGMDFCEDPGLGWSLIDGDCNNWDLNIYPGATEICNGMDDNCDGTVDEGFSESVMYYLDNDADGFGNDSTMMRFCTDPGLPWVIDGGDCYDWDPSMHPGATEVCNMMDDNCDGSIDEGFTTTTYYYDNDGDSFGNDWSAYASCALPGATGWVTIGGDCNDDNGEVHPGAIEICNEMDDNCDGDVDEGFSKTSYYRDYDMDGFGDDMYKMDFCSAPDSGWVLTGGDCYDWSNGINPAAPEICNGMDDNCNGETDEGLTGGTGDFYYYDWDGDGFGGDSAGVLACNSGSGFSLLGGDCDDSNPFANPGMSEITCNNSDDNCDGMVDEGSPFTYYADWDGDGFAGSTPYYFCFDPGAPYTMNVVDFDCNDAQNQENPGLMEICDGLDNNCDGVTDEGFNPTTYFADWDGDGFGKDVLIACTDPGANYTTVGGDCIDSDSNINPSATEICNDMDDDCNGMIDDGLTFTDWFYDGDGDGYGNDLATICYDPGAPYILTGGDCADSDSAIHPSATEVCDGADNNCDTLVDEGVSMIFFADNDADTYGDPANSLNDCSQPVGYISDSTDCDDANPAINPAAEEVVDSVDNNCDGFIDNVSIAENLFNASNQAFEVYPTPANSIVYMKFNGETVNERLTLKVLDVKGKLVYSNSLSSLRKNDVITLNLKELHHGVYQVKIEGSNFKNVSRILVAE